MTLVPAYGRDYSNKAAVEKDFNDNKDFQIASVGRWQGSYVTKRELQETGGESEVTIRYQKLTKAVVLEVK